LGQNTQVLSCVDKMKKIFNNEKIAEEVFSEMYKEFKIGCALAHSGIVKYLYFVRMFSNANKRKEQEFHILIEMMNGGNLEQYLADMPRKREVNI
jgi:hypothetical protein